MEFEDSISDIQFHLLHWFDNHGRDWIPWKLKPDGSKPKSREMLSPYRIWIAEVMLQQTQLKVVLPYWQKWMKIFPSLDHLEEATEKDVFLLWQGLGYYSRAKRIIQSSKLLIQFIGKDFSKEPLHWPTEIDQWIKLPGVGRSTAGSILSSAFDLPTPILDGNVKRILCRLTARELPASQDQKRLWELSSLLISLDNPRNFNQALMDLGAMVCTFRKPNCSCCPIQNFCVAYIKYDPENFPKNEMKKIKPIEEIGIGIVFNKNGELLIDQRLESSSMGGMWEFPGGKKKSDESIEEAILREIEEEVGIFVRTGVKLISFEHSYTNKKLHFTVYLCELISGNPKPLASQKMLWVAPQKLVDFPFPAANTKIISELYKHLSIGNKNF